MNIERKIKFVDIKQGVKGITNKLLFDLISNPGTVFTTRKCYWYASKRPGFEIYYIYRARMGGLYEFYSTYIDERGTVDEIKL